MRRNPALVIGVFRSRIQEPLVTGHRTFDHFSSSPELAKLSASQTPRHMSRGRIQKNRSIGSNSIAIIRFTHIVANLSQAADRALFHNSLGWYGIQT